MAELSKRLSTLGGLLRAADQPPPIYKFEDGDEPENWNVVPIPISLDKRRETLTAMLNQCVEIEGDQARLAEEHKHLKQEILRHQIEFSREMLKLGIRAPMAGENLE